MLKGQISTLPVKYQFSVLTPSEDYDYDCLHRLYASLRFMIRTRVRYLISPFVPCIVRYRVTTKKSFYNDPSSKRAKSARHNLMKTFSMQNIELWKQKCLFPSKESQVKL